MVTNLEIGHYGRLGNQIFQYALLEVMSERLKTDIWLPDENKSVVNGRYNPVTGKTDSMFLALPDLFRLSSKVQFLPGTIIKRHIAQDCIEDYPLGNCFQESILTVPNNTNFFGFFQSWKYYRGYEHTIDSALSIHDSYVNRALDILKQFDGKAKVIVHVRRGDGLVDNGQFQVLLGMDYYKKAMAYFDDYFCDVEFLIISDDPEWCKTNFTEKNHHVIDSKDMFIDFALMVFGHHVIIANSSFSWWGAWLNITPNGIVLCPDKWWGWDLHITEEDIRPPKWIQIKHR